MWASSPTIVPFKDNTPKGTEISPFGAGSSKKKRGHINTYILDFL